MHWADASSVRLLEDLTTAIERLPVLVLVAMRPEDERPVWGLRERVVRSRPDSSIDLRLDALGRDAELALVAGLVGEGALPDDLQAKLFERAGGNPFFLGELLRSLQDAGALTQDGEKWRLNHDVEIELPDTVERVILARIDRLGVAERELLTAAAVIGREFDVPLLGWLTHSEFAPKSLENLIELGLIEVAIPGIEYRFSHPLIQETSYNSMLRRTRSDLHGRAAAALEEVAEEGSDAPHAALARHHAAAGNASAAVKYHRLAGIDAFRVSALDEALTQFDAALEATAGFAESERHVRPELFLLRGRAHGHLGGFAAGSDDFRQALVEARELDDAHTEMRALTELGWLIRGYGYEEAISHQQRALRAAQKLDDRETQVKALGRLSLIHSNRLQLDLALELAERAEGIARDATEDSLLGSALDALKLAALQLGDLELLERTVDEIVVVQERAGDRFFVMWAYIEGSSVPLARGQVDAALELMGRADQLNTHFSLDPVAVVMIKEARSWIDRARGDIGGAVEAVREGAATIDTMDIPEWSAWLGASLGSHLIEAGAPEEAAQVLARALDQADSVKSPNRAFRAASHLALARSMLGDDPGSQDALAQAERIRARITAPRGSTFLNGYHSFLAIARTRQARGEETAIRELLGPLRTAAVTNGWVTAIREMDAVLSELGSARAADDSAAPGGTARARSQENVEMVRAGFEALSRGDLDAMLESYDPEVEFVTLLLGNHHGKEALRGLYEENRKAVIGYTLELDELIDAGNSVIAVARMGGAGRASQIALGDRFAFLFTIKDGLVVRQQTFPNKAEALEAAGLSRAAVPTRNDATESLSDQDLFTMMKRGTRAFAENDVETWLEDWHPECELRPIMSGELEGEVFRGHDGLRLYFEQRSQFIESARVANDELYWTEDGRLLALGRWWIRGRGSEVEVESRGGWIYTVRDGKFATCVSYGDPAAAREAAGPIARSIVEPTQ